MNDAHAPSCTLLCSTDLPINAKGLLQLVGAYTQSACALHQLRICVHSAARGFNLAILSPVAHWPALRKLCISHNCVDSVTRSCIECPCCGSSSSIITGVCTYPAAQCYHSFGREALYSIGRRDPALCAIIYLHLEA